MPEYPQLVDLLSDLFQEDVQIESGQWREIAGAGLALVDMGYQRRSRDADGIPHTQSVRQTVLVSHDPAVNLPRFHLAPAAKGMLSSLLHSLFGGGQGIEFEDSERFSQEYYLHGWAEAAVRSLFGRELRDYFAENVGWSVVGKESTLAIFRHNQVLDDAAREEFKSDALSFVSLFQVAEERLDEVPNLRREATGNDLLATADRMGGLAGSMLKRQLSKIAVSSHEMQEYLSQPTPREIPPGVQRQVLGDTLVLLYVGIFFMIAGLGFLTGIALFPNQNLDLLFRLIPLLPLIMGGLILYFTIRYRRRKTRTLQNGTLVQTKVTQIDRTGTTVNDQPGYKISVEFVERGKTVKKDFRVFGVAVDRARKSMQSGQPLRVLVDPQDPDHLIGVDLLMVME
jgi:Protein of unknown function (DUF3592)